MGLSLSPSGSWAGALPKAREGSSEAIVPLSKEDTLHSNDFCCFTWHSRPHHDLLQEVNAHAGDEERMSRLVINKE